MVYFIQLPGVYQKLGYNPLNLVFQAVEINGVTPGLQAIGLAAPCQRNHQCEKQQPDDTNRLYFHVIPPITT
jgi:hypothetical protein